VEVANPPSYASYLKVLAFHVEHDGSVTTLSKPGDIKRKEPTTKFDTLYIPQWHKKMLWSGCRGGGAEN
jgi:hypothetical protein